MSERSAQHIAVAGVVAVALAASAAIGLSGRHRHPKPKPRPPVTTTTTSVSGTTSTVVIGPGVPADVLNPAVTQATIRTTICVVGWTGTVRPQTTVTEPIKVAQIALYGYSDRNPANYEEDHALALELGGAPSTAKAHANLWPEPHAVSGLDDGTENTLKGEVCAGTLTLVVAQDRLYVIKVTHGYRHDLSAQ